MLSKHAKKINPLAASLSEGAFKTETTLDTGSYILNALVSGSLYGGIPQNRITALAGQSATGKTFFALSVIKTFLESHPDAEVGFFDSEYALSDDMIADRGIDGSRIINLPVSTVEQTEHQMTQILDERLGKNDDSVKDPRAYAAQQPPLMLVLDSLGQLATEKETSDVSEGVVKDDVGRRAKAIKRLFRVVGTKLGAANVPLIFTNHTYKEITAMYPQEVMGGGEGGYYAASTIIGLTKKKEKEGSEVVGNVIHCKLLKSRFTKENAVVDTLLRYDTGLNRYYGLVDFAIKCGIFKKAARRIELPDGTKLFSKAILDDPERVFTADVMDRLESAVKAHFSYGSSLGDDAADSGSGDDGLDGEGTE